MITLTIIAATLYIIIPQVIVLNLNERYEWFDMEATSSGLLVIQTIVAIGVLEYYNYI